MADINMYDGSRLAYLGDAVTELFLREALIKSGIADTGKLTGEAQKLVCAGAQSERAEKIMPFLTEDELAVYVKSRNMKISAKPKHSTSAEYHRATGFESVFGFLYLSGNTERAAELFRIAYPELF